MPRLSFLFDDTSVFSARRVHLAVCGSVACYRSCDLVRALLRLGLNVSVTVSRGAEQFLSPLLFSSLGASPVYSGAFSDAETPFAHLEPGQIAETMLIAPLSANTLAKLAAGQADDMVCAQALAFQGPLLLAPAMNPAMWKHPAVRDNCKKLLSFGAEIIAPGHGTVACGETGEGKFPDEAEIIWALLRSLAPKDLAGKTVLVTMGATREYVDTVRFLSNPASGRMGACLALAAWLRGAEVHALLPPSVSFSLPMAITKHVTESARDMFTEAESLWNRTDMAFFCAAVADFAPEKRVEGKLKKAELPDNPVLSLQRNPDILLSLAAKRRPGQKICAFAAETTDTLEDLLPLAREKCLRKGADLLAANRVNSTESGFATVNNTMAVVDGKELHDLWPSQSKSDVAWRLVSCLLKQ